MNTKPILFALLAALFVLSAFGADPTTGQIILQQKNSGAGFTAIPLTPTANSILGFDGSSNPHTIPQNTGVTAGTYTSATITVGADGRLTAASNGSGGGGAVTIIGTSDQVIVTPSGGSTYTLSLPQSIDTSSDVTFNQMTALRVYTTGAGSSMCDLALPNGQLMLGSGTNAMQLSVDLATGNLSFVPQSGAPQFLYMPDGSYFVSGSSGGAALSNGVVVLGPSPNPGDNSQAVATTSFVMGSLAVPGDIIPHSITIYSAGTWDYTGINLTNSSLTLPDGGICTTAGVTFANAVHFGDGSAWAAVGGLVMNSGLMFADGSQWTNGGISTARGGVSPLNVTGNVNLAGTITFQPTSVTLGVDAGYNCFIGSGAISNPPPGDSSNRIPTTSWVMGMLSGSSSTPSLSTVESSSGITPIADGTYPISNSQGGSVTIQSGVITSWSPAP